MGSGQRFPDAGLPILTFEALSEAQMASLRTQAMQVAEIHGGAALGAASPAASAAVWYFSDPAFSKFSQQVPLSLIGSDVTARIWGAAGLVQVDDSESASVTAMERVLPQDLPQWQREKREGAGRDRRLLGLPASPHGRILFREGSHALDSKAVPDTEVFQGPAAVPEVVKAIATSGLEPPGYLAQWVATSGINPRSSLATEMAVITYALWSLICMDRLDAGHLVSAEHLARRFLQIQRAVRRSPKSPDFSGLEIYGRHMAEITPTAYAPNFDKFVAASMKDEAQTLKQARLTREEQDADEKRRNPKGPQGGGGPNANKKKEDA